MNNFFHFTSILKNYIFYSWNITSIAGLIAVCFTSAFFAAFFQLIKRLENQYQQNFQSQSFDNFYSLNIIGNRCNKISWLAICTGLHGVQILLSYFLMFSVMTFNIWLLISVIFGSGIGYFVFAKTKTAFITLLNESQQTPESSEPDSSAISPRSDDLFVH